MSDDISVATKKNKGKKKDIESKYSKTVLLPQTTFDQRANSVKREPELQKYWEDNDIYNKLSKNNPGEVFTLHDGPPYANGDLHIGHALNKILKDIINKYQLLRGRKVKYVPGWDCHGLPVELKVLQSMKQKERESLTPIALRKKAAQFAQEAVDSQKIAFQRYGVWGDWSNPYMTKQPVYEAAQIRVFGEMVTKGHIYRGKKPVHWSPSSRTALAEAELEYPDNHVSKSIYVGFRVTTLSPGLQRSLGEGTQTPDLRIAIWTTTPWTIPANLAVAVNEQIEYCVASHPSAFNGAKFIVAHDLVGALSSRLALSEGEKLQVEAILSGAELAGTTYKHPLYERTSAVVIGGEYITTDSGTGLVHTAPGHGQEDYITGLKYGLPLLSPVNDAGLFTAEAGESFVGLDVLGEGNVAVIRALEAAGVLIKEEAYNHKYPYDWRTKKPTIFRATEQWFASVVNFRDDVMKAIDQVNWTPAVGYNRISSMVLGRGDWCISRQRTWGVPIPVFYNKLTNEPLMNAETLAHIESVFATHGSDAWWELDVAQLLPESLRSEADAYSKGTDTMDVWFDSGTSWAGVLQARDDLTYPADVYLEGSDQHRGWFQSSLLTSVAANGIAPYKAVLTHGFVLDEKGFKMSKSLGNVVSPNDIINGGSNQKEKPAMGADTLRLWVSGVDYSSDVCVGANIMQQCSESYRKLRNTLRYLIGNLADFDVEKDAVPVEQLPSLDRYILGRLSATIAEVESAYDDYQFYRANSAIFQFASVDLSTFYFDTAKDRLYISAKNDPRRRSCQTVLKHLLEQLTLAMAPIVPHMAEDVWQNLPYPRPSVSVFQTGWMGPEAQFPPHEEEIWTAVRILKDDVNRCIEKARQAKDAGASQDTRVVLHSDNAEVMNTLKKLLLNDQLLNVPDIQAGNNAVDDLRFILLVSQLDFADTIEQLRELCPAYCLDAKDTESGVSVGVARALGSKCDRCWYYGETVGADHEHSEVCPRCADVVKRDGYVVVGADEAAPVAVV